MGEIVPSASDSSEEESNVEESNVEFVFGGTFDPVHLGHIAILAALRQCAPDIPIRLLPCAIPPLKSQPTATFAQRVCMLQLATQQFSNILLDTREKDRQGPSFTVDTLRDLKADFPARQFILVMGMDSLRSINQWFEWERLTALCHLMVINREENGFTNDCNDTLNDAHIDTRIDRFTDTKAQSSAVEKLFCECGFKPAIQFAELLILEHGLGFSLKMQKKPQSSTKIRQLIANKQELDSMLPQSVIEYVRQFHLYKSEPN